MVSVGNHQLRLGAAAAVGAGVGASLLGLYAWNRYRTNRGHWTAPFEEAGRVERLFIYPLKSGKGVETSYLDCTTRGPRNGWLSDREFLLVDELHGHQFLTARTYPAMILVETEVTDKLLTVRFPTGRRVDVDLEEVKKRNDVRQGLLHGQTRTDGLDCGDEIAAAFTEYLDVVGKRSLRVLRFSPDLFTERDLTADPKAWMNAVPNGFQDHMKYADSTSFMINTMASVEDLNRHLEADGIPPVEIRNFRPIIAVSDAPAYDEDRWAEVRIGDAEFVCFRACSRCVLTTVNPDTGVKSAEMQPLKKLREYRLAPEGKLREYYKQSPLFGVHLGLRRAGRIRVGDEVFVRYKSSPF
ncbi:MOSC domain-containing protein [Aphelenchoides fujianensis]|nr:MOSC domain-containing protein [Aphelenchoides fujianensis]